MCLAAPVPAARPGRGTPGGLGAARLFPAQRGDLRAHRVPGAALAGTPDPGRGGGPRPARGQTESAGERRRRLAAARVPFELPRLPPIPAA